MKKWKYLVLKIQPVLLAYVITVALLGYSPLSVAKPAVISWSPSSLYQSLVVGESATTSVTFTATKSLRKVTVRVEPTIAPYVTVSPNSFPIIEKGSTYAIELSFLASGDVPPGVFDGSIYLQKGVRTFENPLPVSIEVREDLLPEAEEVIGPDGGVIVVTDPESPLFGLEVYFPEGALTVPETISIYRLLTIPVIPDDRVIQSGPAFELRRTGSTDFSEPIWVTSAFSAVLDDQEYVTVFHYDVIESAWSEIYPLYFSEESKITFLTYNFSIFIPSVIRSSVSYNLQQDTGFILADDSFLYENSTQTVCSGITGFSQWYYLFAKPITLNGLRCYYDLVRGEQVAQEAVRPNIGIPANSFPDTTNSFYTLLAQLSAGQPVPFSMYEGVKVDDKISFKSGHDVLIYKWVPVSELNRLGYFLSYNAYPNYSLQPLPIEVYRDFPNIFKFKFVVPNIPEWNYFAVWDRNWNQMNTIFSKYGPNGTCYCKDDDADGYSFSIIPDVGDCDLHCNIEDQSACDCNDSDATINPDATEDCCDSVDNDCDNDIDGADSDCLDSDGNGIPDDCEIDTDNDGVPDDQDNCPYDPNPQQENFDGDSLGDACDTDDDNDGVLDIYDACPQTPEGALVDARGCPLDSDSDGVPDYIDACPGTPIDVPVNERGCDANAPDRDGDGVPDDQDAFPDDPTEWKDTDGDGIGDNADPDDDGDNILDVDDNCPLVPNPDQSDFDDDGKGDVCDPDPYNNGGQGGGWGDPHLVTFDRLAYDFQGAGEFIMANSLIDDFEIQARMSPWGTSRVVSIQSALAMNVSGDSVGVYVGRSPALYVNGEPTLLTDGMLFLPSGGVVESLLNGYKVVWPDSSHALITLKSTYLNFKLVVPVSRFGQLEGLLGDFDGSRVDELVTREGEIINTPPSVVELYNQYGESWRITQDESLFDYVDGNTTDTFTDRTFPAGFVTSIILSDTDREEAELICGEAGITDSVLLEACILDVGITGDSSFAEFPASVVSSLDSIAIDDSLGQSIDNPAKSCLEIQQYGVVDGDRKYWIELPSGVYEMHCNFSAGPGGWTRVAALDTTLGYCGNNELTDLRDDPDASMGKIPDSDTQALMTGTPGSPMELMYFSRIDGRYVWHALENVTDFDTSSKHSSSSFYCTNWHCDNGSIDASACGTEGNGCPVIARGIGGYYKKIYVDSSFSRHIRGMHVNGTMCGLPNYERASIWIYVR